MTEYFRITGKNTILFDTAGGGPYVLAQMGNPPLGLSEPLTRQEAMGKLSQVPLEIRPHILMRGLSIITFEITITGTTDADMEAKRHDLTETLEDTTLYFSTQGGRGTRAELLLKADGAVGTSYKSIFYGICEELGGRDVLGAAIKAHRLEVLKVTLYCEPYWRPSVAVELGPNEIKTPSFERDSNADGLADNWAMIGAPVCIMRNIDPRNGCWYQKVTTDAANEGIDSAGMVAPAGTTQAVAYAWVCRASGISDVRVVLRDNTAGANRDNQFLSTAGWQTKVVGSITWYRVVVSSNAIVAGNTHILRIISSTADATIFYVDMTFFKWGTTVCPDEWIDYYTIYNHEDPQYDYPNHIDHLNHIDLADLKGDMEAPIYLKISPASNFGANIDMEEFYFGIAAPWECNSKSYEDLSGAVDATRSGGQVLATGVAAASGWVWVGELILTAAQWAAMQGRWRVVFAGKAFAACTLRWRTRGWLAYPASVQIHEGKPVYHPEVDTKWAIVDVGAIDIKYPRAGDFAGDDLRIAIYADTSIDTTVYVDFIMLFPEDASIAWLDKKETIWSNYYFRLMVDSIYFDGTYEFPYCIGTSQAPERIGWIGVPKGEYLKVRPGVDNRLTLIVGEDDTANTKWVHLISRDFKIWLSYLPQYISPLE